MVSRLRSPLPALLIGLMASCTGALGVPGDGPGPGAGAGGSGQGGPGGRVGGVGGGGNPIGTGGSPGADGTAPGLLLDGAPSYSRFVRLTHEQWENSVRD